MSVNDGVARNLSETYRGGELLLKGGAKDKGARDLTPDKITLREKKTPEDKEPPVKPVSRPAATHMLLESHLDFKTKSVLFPALNCPNYPLKSYRAEAFYETLLVPGRLPVATSFTDHRVRQQHLRIYFKVSKAVNRLTN